MELKSANRRSERGQKDGQDEGDRIEHKQEVSKGDAVENSKLGSVYFPQSLENGKISPEDSLEVNATLDHSITLPAFAHSDAKDAPLFSRSVYNSKARGRRCPGYMKLTEAILRFGGALLSLIALSVMTATHEKRTGAGSTFEMKFSDFQAYNYLVALNVISFVYSSGQLIKFGHSNSSSVFSSPFKWALSAYICDQILAFLLFSASSSAATASELSRHGLHNIWPPACSMWQLWLFCAKVDAAVVMSFFSSFFVMLSSVFSGYYLAMLLAE